jgi:hypothetical protein
MKYTAYVSWNGLHYYCTNCTAKTLGFRSKCEKCGVKLVNPTKPYKTLALDRPDLYTSVGVKQYYDNYKGKL